MDFSHLLNNKQLEAVETTSKNVRVIAGAGSGKTRVLTYRIAYLISEQHVSPSNILAITFTNKVANEMKERALNLIEENYGYRPFLRISTFHSFCAFFLRQEAISARSSCVKKRGSSASLPLSPFMMKMTPRNWLRISGKNSVTVREATKLKRL